MCSGVALWWLFGLASLPSTFPHIPLVPDAAPCLWGPEILAAQALFARHGEFEPFPLMLCFGMLSSKPPLVLPWGVCGTPSTHARPSWSDPHVSVRCTVGQVPGPCPCCPCCLCSWQGKESREKGIVHGMDNGQCSGDQDGAHRALARAAVLVLSKT